MQIYDCEPQINDLREVVQNGLQQPQKTLPNTLLFDDIGLQLFEKVCDARDYYPARTELALMHECVDQISSLAGSNCLLIEYGSGSIQKTRILLDHLPELAGYVPIDISKDYLVRSASKVALEYPNLEILPVCTDYNQFFNLPCPSNPCKRRLAYHAGITIGNVHPSQASAFLARVRQTCGDHGALLLSVDLKKDPRVLEAAYNDSEERVAAFSLNMLMHLNRELGANFQVEQFRYQSIYNPDMGRMEMYLISCEEQTVYFNDQSFKFASGERIWTDCSYKYTLKEFADIASQAGWSTKHVWQDGDELLSIYYLTA